MITPAFEKEFQSEDLDISTIALLDERLFHIGGFCPVAMDGDSLRAAATLSFADDRVLDNIRKTVAKNICLLRVDDEGLSSLKKRIFSGLARGLPSENGEQTVRHAAPGHAEDLKIFTGELSEAVKLANRIIIQAYRERATDIHLQKDGEALRVRHRIDGILYDAGSYGTDIYESLLTRFKVMGRLDIAESRMPQSGRSTVRIESETVSLRISTLPSRSGEKVSVRFLTGVQDLIPIEELGLNSSQRQALLSPMSGGKGIFVIGGPTGSGKTTTLYSVIRSLNDGTKNIITLEDPAEIELGSGIIQVQVGSAAGIKFNDGIRAILRHDPDIILVGEIRDRESAQAAFEAALTGHLVLTTVHMPTVLDIVERLWQLDIDPLTIESSLVGVATQRLVRRICPACSRHMPAPDQARRFFSGFGLTIEHDMKPIGCDSCCGRGFFGRTGIFDLRLADDTGLMDHFRSRDKKIFERKDKYRELARAALDAVHAETTSSEEVMRSLW